MNKKTFDMVVSVIVYCIIVAALICIAWFLLPLPYSGIMIGAICIGGFIGLIMFLGDLY